MKKLHLITLILISVTSSLAQTKATNPEDITDTNEQPTYASPSDSLQAQLKWLKKRSKEKKETLREKASTNYHAANYTLARSEWQQYVEDFGYDLSDLELYQYFQLECQWKEYELAEKIVDNIKNGDLRRSLTKELEAYKASYVEDKITLLGETNIPPNQNGVGMAWYDGKMYIPMQHDVPGSDVPDFKINVYEPISKSEFYLRDEDFLKYTGQTIASTPFFYKDKLYFSSKMINNDTKATLAGISVTKEELLNIYEYPLTEKNRNTKIRLYYTGERGNNYTFPFLLSDKVLIFSTDQKGSLGGFDIMYSTKGEMGWSEAKPLEGVNTEGNEMYPYVKNNEFFFSSDGRDGFGGVDIYKGEFINKNGYLEVRNVENLEFPINTEHDEFAFTPLDDHLGFLISNRYRGDMDDVLWFNRNVERVDLEEVTEKLSSVETFKESFLEAIDLEYIDQSMYKYMSDEEKALVDELIQGDKYLMYIIDENGEKIFYVIDEDRGNIYFGTDENGESVFYTMDENGNKTYYSKDEIVGRSYYVLDDTGQKHTFTLDSNKDRTYYIMDEIRGQTFYSRNPDGTYAYYSINENGEIIDYDYDDIKGRAFYTLDDYGRKSYFTVLENGDRVSYMIDEVRGRIYYSTDEYGQKSYYKLNADGEKTNLSLDQIKWRDYYTLDKTGKKISYTIDDNGEIAYFDLDSSGAKAYYTIDANGQKMYYRYGENGRKDYYELYEKEDIDETNIRIVYFDFAKYALDIGSTEKLEKVLIALNEDPESRVILEGHADSYGSAQANMRISSLRSKSVMKYLVENGINQERIKTMSYGETRLLMPSCEDWDLCSDEENELNRRVEIKINEAE